MAMVILEEARTGMEEVSRCDVEAVVNFFGAGQWGLACQDGVLSPNRLFGRESGHRISGLAALFACCWVQQGTSMALNPVVVL